MRGSALPAEPPCCVPNGTQEDPGPLQYAVRGACPAMPVRAMRRALAEGGASDRRRSGADSESRGRFRAPLPGGCCTSRCETTEQAALRNSPETVALPDHITFAEQFFLSPLREVRRGRGSLRAPRCRLVTSRHGTTGMVAGRVRRSRSRLPGAGRMSSRSTRWSPVNSPGLAPGKENRLVKVAALGAELACQPDERLSVTPPVDNCVSPFNALSR